MNSEKTPKTNLTSIAPERGQRGLWFLSGLQAAPGERVVRAVSVEQTRQAHLGRKASSSEG